jgi:protein arginine kinase activator
MVCEHCKQREAVIHLTQIVDNSVTTMHLCEACAAEKGVETEAEVAKFPLGDFLASLGKPATAEQGDAAATVPCRSCGATLADFRQTSRLGCARCYESFEPHLRDLLRRLHGSTRHVGEAYRAPGDAEPPASLVDSGLGMLRDQLRRAVESENFELAAQLRDQIRVKE